MALVRIMSKMFSLLLFVGGAALVAQNTSVPTAAPQADAPPAQGAALAPAAVVEQAAKKDEPQPWRLGTALSFPEWLSIGMNHRSRYEGLTNQFRTGAASDQPIYALRTLFSAEAKWNQLALKAELIDSRVYFAAPVTPLDPTFVDTLDLGNRRLVARNRFRNTINAFTGLDTGYKFANEDRLRLFAKMPVQRVPDNLNDIQANMAKLDFQSANVLFGGLYYENRSLVKNFVGEVYALGQLGQTRVPLEYQHDSGNPSSNGGRMSRFDPLFGLRRSMFGPTGLYGAIALSNINTPGVRVDIKPTASVRTFAAYRAIWLADASDAWTVTGLQDKSGNAGAFLGHQFEGEVIWNILTGNLRVEAGFAYLSLGGFPRLVCGVMDSLCAVSAAAIA